MNIVALVSANGERKYMSARGRSVNAAATNVADHADDLEARSSPPRNRWPIGISPGKNRRAISSLMITGAICAEAIAILEQASGAQRNARAP